ncbi:MAG: hypothetical protein C0514_01915 [Candidatus Puniceispirillum sp.]|nr:hypothetical protein [Candidatus Puniceispirillum sp.]
MPVYSVASQDNPLELIAHFVDDTCAGDPFTLTRTLCILPTRRACRMLERALIAHAKTPSRLLPKILCLSDLATKDLGLAPQAPHSSNETLFSLMRFLCEENIAPHPSQAYHWARALTKLLDGARLHKIDLYQGLEALLGAEHALHRQGALEGLLTLLAHWHKTPPLPSRCDDHVQALEMLMERLCTHNTHAPVITLGIHHSAPIYTRLLATCASLDKGTVLMNDFDHSLTQEHLKGLSSSHPQWIHARLLEALDLSPEEVLSWGARTCCATLPFLARAFEDTFAKSKEVPKNLGLNHLAMIEARDRFEEATFASLLIREALDDPNKKVLMVTPDRQLAALVGQMLRKWQIIPDDGAGMPLTSLTPFVFLMRVLEAVGENFSPMTLLALLKHPLFGGGSAARTFARTLETRVLRRPLAPQTLEACLSACQGDEALYGFLKDLQEKAAPFTEALRQKGQPLADLLEAHLSLALTLCAKETLWEGEHAAEMATHWQDVLEAAPHFPELSPHTYLSVFPLLFKDQTVRRQHGIHPRVAILSPQQAQLMKADRVLICGLSEGLWPLLSPPSPWLSPAMEASLGLGDDTHTLAEAGRLFTEFCQAGEVFLMRSMRLDGTPQTPARVWQRLEALLKSEGITLSTNKYEELQAWQKALYTETHPAPCERPAPRPRRALRPKQVSVSSLGLLQQDPYAFYVRNVLKLSPLEAIAPPPDARLFGTLLHGCLEAFVASGVLTVPQWDAVCQARLKPLLPWGAVHLFWTKRLASLGPWILESLSALPKDTRFFTEAHASLALFEGLTLVAKADRIDVSVATGHVTVIDYKTGALPTKAEREVGLALQLPLEAHMLAQGSFANVPKPVSSQINMQYWHLRPPYDIVALGNVVDQSLTHTQDLWEHFWVNEAPYLAPFTAPSQTFLPQEHMSRIQEWQHT